MTLCIFIPTEKNATSEKLFFDPNGSSVCMLSYILKEKIIFVRIELIWKNKNKKNLALLLLLAVIGSDGRI